MFTLTPMTVRSYEQDKDTQFDMTIEMNMNLKMIQRNSYSILDLLSDIGGMLGMLISGINFLLIFWNYNYFENYLVTRLFKL